MRKHNDHDHNQELNQLREGLAPIAERCEVPETLLRPALEAQQRRKFPLRRAAALALALVFALGVGIVSDRFNLFSSNEALRPIIYETVNGGEEAALGDYYELEKAFVRIRDANASNFWDDVGEMFTWVAGAALEKSADGAAPESGTGGTTVYTTSRATDEAHGETNAQVSGIDEADILKNDGRYLYYAASHGHRNEFKVRIIEALPTGELKVVSSISVPGNPYSLELYVEGDRMAMVYCEYPNGGGVLTTARIYDIGDRASPLLVTAFSQEGNILSSRLKDGRIYLVSLQGINLGFEIKDGVIPEEEILPTVYEDDIACPVPADRIAVLPESTEPNYLMVSSVDLHGNSSSRESAAVLGSGGQMYMSHDAIYAACVQHTGFGAMPVGGARVWQGAANKTVIYKFNLGENGKVSAGGSGEVQGSALNQFSMDEHDGVFRIATTGTNKSGDRVNMITTLDKNLKVLGVTDGLAKGETIQSCRFIGTMAYMVTFLQTDPLFVIDLSDPKNPQVKGELKIPGFSAYLHPWDEKHLIGIGPDGDDDGTNNNTKISLFDISNPANPREVDKLVIPNTYTEIQHNHKQFVRYAEKNLFGLPLMHHSNYYNRTAYSSFYTFKVVNNRLERALTLEANEPQFATVRDNYGNSWEQAREVTRGTYIGDGWYVMGVFSAAAYAMDSGELLGSAELKD